MLAENLLPGAATLLRLARIFVEGDPLEVVGERPVDSWLKLHRKVIVQRLVVIPDHVARIDSQPVDGVQ